MNELLSILKKRPIIFDGAMGTMIQARVQAECNALLNLTRPDVIASVHSAYFDAGADIVITNTFGASSIDLADHGLSGKMAGINRAAVKIARDCAVKASKDKKRFVAGEIGPTSKLPTLGHVSYGELFNSYSAQIAVFLKEGVDCLVVQTCQDILQMKAATAAAREEISKKGADIPVIVAVTIEKTGSMLLGTDIMAALAAIEPFKPAAFGINCATGPEMMEEHVHQLYLHSPFPIILRPNAGTPENVGGKPVYTLSPDDFALRMKEFVDNLKVAMVGGCCGTTPAHIAALVPLLCKPALSRVEGEGKGEVDLPRPTSPYKGEVFKPSVSSLFSTVSLDQEPRPFLIAEQTNVNGSKKFKELLLKNDYDGMAAVAKEAAKGAHALDVCVAYPGRDEIRDISEVVSRIAKAVDSPVMIDSTNPAAIEKALSMAPGRCIINSINLEDGGIKAKKVLSLAKKFGAAVVCLTIDEDGMARTAEKKVGVAKRLHELALSSGFTSEDLLFDALTFTVGSGDATLIDAAVQTLEGIRRIKKEMRGSRTLLGVSNISFGLTPDARRLVTSIFLADALEAGLDAAIVNPLRILRLSQIPKEEEALARRVLKNDHSKGPPLQNLLKYFVGSAVRAEPFDSRPFTLSVSKRERTLAQDRHVEVRTEYLLRQKILDGDKSELASVLDDVLRKRKPQDIINSLLLPAMKEVGELFGKGRLPLPFVLQSAEVMRAAIDILSPGLKEGETTKRGTIVLATVRGDVHDIGKNLVDIILTNNGFEVVNLGIRQPIGAVLDAAKRNNAAAIGLSGLLVSSTEIMKEDLETLKHQGVKTPVLVGGAALTKKFTQSTLQKNYDGPVYYCEDAFAGLKALEEVVKR